MMTGRVRTWALRLSLAAGSIILLLMGVFVWRAMNGPVSLGFMAPQLESMINAGLSDVRIRFDDSVIAWSEDRDLAYLQFIGLRVVDENEGVIARIPKANVTLSGPELLRGVAAPTSIELVGVSANVVRRSSGDMQLGLQVGSPKKKSPEDKSAAPSNVPADILRSMLEPGDTDKLSRALKKVSISQARLSVFDEETRSSWIADKATLAFQRRTNGVTVSLRAPVKLADGKTWQFSGAARYTKGKPDVLIEADFRPVKLSQLAGNGTGLQFL